MAVKSVSDYAKLYYGENYNNQAEHLKLLAKSAIDPQLNPKQPISNVHGIRAYLATKPYKPFPRPFNMYPCVKDDIYQPYRHRRHLDDSKSPNIYDAPYTVPLSRVATMNQQQFIEDLEISRRNLVKGVEADLIILNKSRLLQN